ncbi:hypothetical protein GKC30_02780 [Pseudodesulfovibrio sp. F-1]|uniref:Uncharacterized protein n=1 Tax=Pseudodesulfovibrio alkaliphilus TaxID=2661613 RepID=A0A7K1KKG0_9BACT|nr:hypothetical protein [Pseudodesulfovibrio alkaliphilus]MUM76555.1 hypothetical protein [Pseudodesulfovibrio alkaliphilus]
MRTLSLLLSFFLHALIATVLIQTLHLGRTLPPKLMELDLTALAEPVIAPFPEPTPLPAPLPVEPAPEPQPQALPMDKTILLDDAPPPEPAPAHTPASVPPPQEPPPVAEAIDISPVKTVAPSEPPPPSEEASRPSPAGEQEEGKGPPIMVSRHDVLAHRGHEARFGRSMMAEYYTYESSEFSGQFQTRDDRTISIIDARDTEYGRFLIYDSKNKTLRRLKEFAKYIYTIGPSLYADEPVTGTVTFLAKDDRIERFILMTDDDRIAHFPVKVHVRESDVQFAAPGADPAPKPKARGKSGKEQDALAGRATLPPAGGGHPGVVLTYGERCVDDGLVRGFTRALSASGLAVFSFRPRGCDESGEAVASVRPEGISVAEAATRARQRQAADTAAALAYFVGLEAVDGSRAGVWGNGTGVAAGLALALALEPEAVRPAFLVCLLDDSVGPDGLPGSAGLARLDMPVLWLITGRNLGRWQSFVSTLESLRDGQGLAFTIVMAPLRGGQEVLGARGEFSGWVEQVAEEHARLGASWIAGLAQ